MQSLINDSRSVDGAAIRSITAGSQHGRAQQPAEPTTGGQHQQQQKGQTETAWSLLGKLYSSQVLAYMVAITDAQALVRRMRSMRPGPPLHIPGEVLCMDLWQTLQGSIQQQHVWTFGDQAAAAMPTQAAEGAPAAAGGAAPRTAAETTATAATSAAQACCELPIEALVQPCISSREPHAIKAGVRFISCAAGRQHSAAAAEGGYVFTWGSNNYGQLGCDTDTAQPVAIHVLNSPATDATLAVCGSTAAGATAAATSGTGVSRAMLTKLDSLKQLSSTVKLPPSLLTALQQQREREQQAAAEERELPLQEQHQQQQLANKALKVPQPYGTQAAVHTAVLGGLHGGVPQQQQQQQQQQDAERPQALVVYQLNLGQAVRSVACGAHHTLAALSSSGLVAWGLNDKGQLGAPACSYQQSNSPMRIHGFNGQRLLCVSAGAKHSAAVQEGGMVVTWGHGRNGRLGVGGTPDILPPSVVASLRGCLVTQVACGTAHTLALTADGRVYACGYNGQGALGTGDDADRLFPVLVPGLPSCIQVAAAASSMALSSDGQVFLWGGAAGKQLAGTQAAVGWAAECGGVVDNSGGSSCSGGAACGAASCETAPAAAKAASSSSTQKWAVPWMQGVSAVQIACGLDTAAAVSSTGQVLFWGKKECLPISMLHQAQPLAHCTGGHTKLAAGGSSNSALTVVPGAPATPNAQQVDAAQAESQQVVGVRLLVQASGAVQLLLSFNGSPAPACEPQHSQQHAQQHSQQQTQQQQQHTQQQQQPVGPLQGDHGDFNPLQEPLQESACGASHHVMLCQPSEHTPSHDELRAAALAVLRAYISSFNSTNTSSLNMLMQQQQSGANWAGSICGGPAKSTVSHKPAGGPSSVLSFACSPPNPAQAAAAHSSSSGASTSAAKPADPHSGKSKGMQQTGSGIRSSASGALVSFADRQDGEDGTEAAGIGAHALASDNKAALQSKSERIAGYAPSGAGSISGAGKGQARSVLGSNDGSGVGRRPGSAGVVSGSPSMQLSLHGVMVLCKEVCLLDNITEHMDVIQTFELMLHRKRGRLGPPQQAAPAQSADAPAVCRTASGALPGAAPKQPSSCAAAPNGQQCAATTGAAASPPPAAKPGVGVQAPHNSPLVTAPSFAEPDTLTVVHVLRPNEPAVQPCSSTGPGGGPPASQGSVAGSRPASPGPLAEGTSNGRPSSRGAFGRTAVGQAAAAASGMDSICTLDADEVLEMLLLLMKERHPCYRRQPDSLLRMLAGWHLCRLKGRRPEQGPPWLLRQALQPDVVTALESHSTTEMLHGIYVALAGSSTNMQDLSMHLSDIRLGLRCAAGRCTPQDLQRQQQQQQGRWGAAVQHRGSGSSRQTQLGSGSSRSHRYLGSTESSRGRRADPVPYDPSMHPGGGAQCADRTSSKLDGTRPEKGFCDGFQLPLHKLATFIRTAKLLPRLLDKYLHQLQLQGGEQERAADGQRLDSLPLMPCLQIQLQQGAAGGSVTTSGAAYAPNAHSRRSTQAAADPLQQQGSLQAETSRLGPLSFFDLPVRRRTDSLQRNSSIGSRLSLVSPVSQRAPADALASCLPTSREPSQTGRVRGKPRARFSAVHALDVSMVDATALNTAELLPLRSSTACVQLVAPQVTGTSSSGAKLRASTGGAAAASISGAAAMKLLLQLPPAGASQPARATAVDLGPVSTSSGSGERTRFAQNQPQGPAANKGKRAKATTYQQQQVLLQQQQQTDAASAQLAKAQLAACQDVWIALMLVELLGSHLITPQHSTAVRIPQPCSSDHQQMAGVCPSSSSNNTASQECTAGAEWFVWDRGYCFTGDRPGVAGQPATHPLGSSSNGSSGSRAGSMPSVSGSGATSSASGASACSRSSRASGGVLDLLNHGITYPQFVEVLLCLMSARSVCVLEPDVKEIRGITLNEELQDHAHTVLERIAKWRQTQLTPWKQQQQQGASEGGAPATTQGSMQPPASSPSTQPQRSAGPGPQTSATTRDQQVMCRVYATYSSMKPGSSVLGLHLDGYLQLLRDAGILAASSEFTTAEAASIFKAACGTSPACSASHPAQSSAAATAGSPASTSGAAGASNHTAQEGAAIRPAAFGSEQRQSTFMRCVTQHLLQGLTAGAAGMEEPHSAAGQPGLSQAPTAAAKEPHASSEEAEQQAGVDASSCSSTSTSQSSSTNTTRPSSSYSSCMSGSSSSTATNSTTSTTTSSTDGVPEKQQPSSGSPQAIGATDKPAAAPAAAAAPARSGAKAGTRNAVLTFMQFMTSMRQLSRSCFPRIANGARAWDLLLERHVQPLADRKHSRYSQLAASLSTPGMVALLAAFAPQLQRLHTNAAATNAAMCNQKAALPQQQQQQQRPPQQLVAGVDAAAGPGPAAAAAGADAGASAVQQVLSLSGFLQLLQDSCVIPQLLEPGDVQEVLRQLLVTLPDQDSLFTSLDCSKFSQALCMCGLAAFAGRRLLQPGAHLQAPEQQLVAFLKLMGLTLHGQQPLGPGSLARPAPAYGAGGAAGPATRHSGVSQQQATDPYIEWWSLQFDPAAESRAHDHLSSLHHPPVMLQEVLQPPSCCPPEVLPLLSAAQAAHQSQEWDDALHLLQQAEQAWQTACKEQQQAAEQRWSLQQPGLSLPTAAVLYLVVTASSCLLSAKRDEEAVQVLQGVAGVVQALHEAGAEAALWHAAAGVAKYHHDDLKGAFEHLTRAYVVRSECGSLGVGHPDTATAAHNLGVVLDCLGKSSRGLQLVQEARQVFSATLGPQHVRTLAAARNEQHIKHKVIKLPAQPSALLAEPADTPAAAECPQALTTQRSGRTPAQSGSSRRGPAAHGAVAAGALGSSSGDDTDDDDGNGSRGSSSDGQQEAPASSKTRRGKHGGSSSSRGGRRGAAAARHAGKATGRATGRAGSMQERLQAVTRSRQTQEEAVLGPRVQEVVETRDYTDASYLGASMFKASAAQQQLYRSVVADIQAHAQGLSSSGNGSGSGGGSQQMGFVEVQVLPRRQGSSSPGPAAATSAAAVATGSTATATQGRSAGVLEVHKGALPDATTASVRRPRAANQLRRRQQQQRGAKGGSSLLEKIYT